MTVRRFDTDVLLEQLLGGDPAAFKAFYERYRGRVYRFITRQCGNGEVGRAVYVSIWAQLIATRLECGSTKALKYAFLRSLQKPSFKPLVKRPMITQLTIMPRELDEEGGWSTLLIDLIRRLPEGQRKRFLFRYELGLSHNAIAMIFGEASESTQRGIEAAEHELLQGLQQAGCTRCTSLEGLYRETRHLKPPLSWEKDVLDAYADWLQRGVPPALLQVTGDAAPSGSNSIMKSIWRKTLSHIRSAATEKLENAECSSTQRP